MTNLQKVKEKIIKAVPSILDLNFGCFYKYKGRKGVFQVNGDLIKTLKQEDITSLGRPIILEDVLMALNFKGDFVIDSSGEFYKYEKCGLTRLEARYNLSRPLEAQDEDVIEFLLNNL